MAVTLGAERAGVPGWAPFASLRRAWLWGFFMVKALFATGNSVAVIASAFAALGVRKCQLSRLGPGRRIGPAAGVGAPGRCGR